MIINSIELFGLALTSGPKVDPEHLISMALRAGYIVHPDCCTQEVLKYIENARWNPNSTFYATWADMENRGCWGRVIDQVLHYMSTYGTDYTADAYVPNGEPVLIPLNTYKTIMPASHAELYARCLGMLSSGSALSEATTSFLIDFVYDAVKNQGCALDLSSIRNRDALCLLSTRLDMVPTRGEDILRVLYYKIFGKTQMVMSAWAVQEVQTLCWNRSCPATVLTGLTESQMIALAKVFYRYKKFLLAFRSMPENRPVVNRIRNLARKHHEPFVPGFWESFTQRSPLDMAEVQAEVDKLDNTFKLVRLHNLITTRRLQNASKSPRLFKIRNGSSWIEDKRPFARFDGDWVCVQKMLMDKIVERVKKNVGSITADHPVYVKYPEAVNLACPTSEKLFAGNVPHGSWIPFTSGSSNCFGIYWRNEWGTKDFDLSFITAYGDKFGWDGNGHTDELGNANYKNTIRYSGDMTDADPEAAEVISVLGDMKTVPNGLVYVNRYNGEPESPVRVFVARGAAPENAIVDPNDIVFQSDVCFTKREYALGCVADGRFYFNTMEGMNRHAAEVNVPVIQTFIDNSQKLMLKEVLEQCGCLEWTAEHGKRGIMPSIDLSSPKKDQLLKLFA